MHESLTGKRRKAALPLPLLEEVPEGFVETKMAKLVRATYELYRSEYESLLTDDATPYKAPKSYGHRAAQRLADAEPDAAPLQKEKPSVWEALAKFFLKERIEPSLYIRVQFEPDALKLFKPPTPQQLSQPERYYFYQQALETLGRTLEIALQEQQQTARTEISFIEGTGRGTLDACACVIANEGLDLTPLFRYCLARSMTGERFQALARRLALRAALQFICYKDAYQHYWKDYLPVGFARLAERLYLNFVKC